MIGSPAVRDSMGATAVSFRALAACRRSPEANAAAKLTTARHAGCNQLCLCFRLTKRDVIVRSNPTGSKSAHATTPFYHRGSLQGHHIRLI